MTYPYRFDNKSTFEKALADNINLFLGAGFSILASNKEGRSLPLGNQLKEELIEYFEEESSDKLSLSQLATILQAKNKDEFRTFLRNRYSVESFGESYFVLEQLSVNKVFTTNVDNLVHRIYEKSTRHYIHDVIAHGPSFSDRAAIDYVPLHGSILNEENPLVFNTLDIASSFSDDPDKWHALTQNLQNTPTLFWGFSLDDADVLQAINPASVKGREHKPKWILLKDEDQATSQYFEALGFQLIIGDTTTFLEFLNALQVGQNASPFISTSSPTEVLFPYDCIPQVGKVPVRPIMEFYLGNPPTWSDIYSGQIHKTRHFNSIVNSINSGKNTIVVGIPASGKSTLLMQVAAELEFDGHKIAPENLTKEKADFIINKLSGESAIVFVDDFGDDIDAFNTLLGHPNIAVVGFERGYYYEIISHRLRKENVNFIDVTELNPFDIQQIYSRIPSRVRNVPYIIPKVEGNSDPSVFEIIEANTSTPSLRSRFQSVLRQLQKQKPILADILIMIAYVHACRVPASFDMVFSFLRGKIRSYQEIYDLVGDLGLMLSDYAGSMVDEEQDYYVARSTYMADAILNEVNHKTFKRVFLTFHENVSAFRVNRFDVFKRKAFDAKHVRMAFENWDEGKAFYDKIYSRDNSPYLLQQCALYLLGKRQYKEAFQEIDKAVTLTANKIPSIRNTHAVVLFKTNIGIQDTDGTVIRTLRQSMDILEECYADDKRKTYHAITFASQALSYYQAYPDSHGLEYLETARDWLKEEGKSSPWNREIGRLSKLVNRQLAKSA